MNKKFGVLACIYFLLLGGCSNDQTISKDCPEGIIDYLDVLALHDVEYALNTSDVNETRKGKKIGEVTYMLDGHACSDHQMVHGDATYLPIGTQIYEHRDYKRDFRVIANNRLYEVRENKLDF